MLMGLATNYNDPFPITPQSKLCLVAFIDPSRRRVAFDKFSHALYPMHPANHTESIDGVNLDGKLMMYCPNYQP